MVLTVDKSTGEWNLVFDTIRGIDYSALPPQVVRKSKGLITGAFSLVSRKEQAMLTSIVSSDKLSLKSLHARDYVFQTLKSKLVKELRDIQERRQYYMARLRGLDEKEARILASFE